MFDTVAAFCVDCYVQVRILQQPPHFINEAFIMKTIKTLLDKIIHFKGVSSFFPKNELSYPQRRLAKALKENAGTYTINRDGKVFLDLSNPKTIEKIVEQINKCGKIKTERA